MNLGLIVFVTCSIYPTRFQFIDNKCYFSTNKPKDNFKHEKDNKNGQDFYGNGSYGEDYNSKNENKYQKHHWMIGNENNYKYDDKKNNSKYGDKNYKSKLDNR